MNNCEMKEMKIDMMRDLEEEFQARKGRGLLAETAGIKKALEYL